MDRKTCLETALDVVTKGRQDQYGTPENNFDAIARLWSSYLNMKLLPLDVAAMMILLKLGRTRTGDNKEDNWVDIAGYAACGAEVSDTE